MMKVRRSTLRKVIREEYLKILIKEEQAFLQHPRENAKEKANQFIQKIVDGGIEPFLVNPKWYKKLRGELFLYNELAKKFETDDYLKRAYSRKFPGWTQKDFQYFVSLLPREDEIYTLAREASAAQWGEN
jgi:hypothetical protein